MEESPRINKSLRNVVFIGAGYLAYTFIGFFARSTFIDTLGISFSGVDNLLSGLSQLLALSDMGIYAAVMIHLYKPIAEGDERRTCAIIRFNKVAYNVVTAVLVAVSAALAPFITTLMPEGTTIPNFRLYFFLYVIKTAVTFVAAYKVTLLQVYQKQYLISNITYAFLFLQLVLEIIILRTSGSYLYFLFLQIFITLATNIALTTIANRKYPYIKNYSKAQLPLEERTSIFKHMRSVILNGVCRAVSNSADSFIISSFLGFIAMGFSGNYIMIFNVVNTLLGRVFHGVTATVSNFNATAPMAAQKQTLADYGHVSFYIGGLCAVCFVVLASPFMVLWLGPDFTISEATVISMGIILFIQTGQRPVNTNFTLNRLIRKYPWYPLVNATVNVGVSLLLVKPLGLTGIYVGTICGFMLGDFIILPIALYHNVYHDSPLVYYAKFSVSLLVTAAAFGICCVIRPYVSATPLGWMVMGGLCVGIFTLLYLAAFWKTCEQKTVFRLIKNIIKHKN